MNLSALTAREVLRICVPETDLERRLFDICKELETEADERLADAEQAASELENYECDCDDNTDEIKKAIGLIEVGKVQDGAIILKRLI